MASAEEKKVAVDKPVVLLDDVFRSPWQESLHEEFEILMWEEVLGFKPHTDAEEYKEKLESSKPSKADRRPDVIGLLVHHHPVVDGAILDVLPNLKFVSNFGVGYDHVIVPDHTARGIKCSNTPTQSLFTATADMAFALLLASARGVCYGHQNVRSGKAWDSMFLGDQVSGTTLGIVGMGNIGSLIARRAAGFDMKILYHNRTQKQDEKVMDRTATFYADLHKMLPECDFVILACPVTPTTTGIMNATRLNLMKKTAHLINIGRGKLVVTDDLTKALQDGTIKGAGLDVFDPEPLPNDHPLLKMDNVTCTPHTGSASYATRKVMFDCSVENLRRGIAGKPAVNPVN